MKFQFYALGPFDLPENANDIYETQENDPLHDIMNKKKLKPILFI